ncbi:MAG TPA: DUF1634 domain-containing protein [Thermomicrobiales bacterium]|nr:DUF1634 domain-containing protein [Thermomicrobiales bacterium]
MATAPRPEPDRKANQAPDLAPPPAHRMELWISVTLRAGVLLAGAVVAIGLLRFLLAPALPGEPRTVAELLAAEFHPTSLPAILDGVAAARPTSLIRLGIFILVLTPTARVLLTLLLFLAQRDWAFVVVTAIVLTVLVLGLLGLVG